ncbi:hypothetical protein [Sphingorhabdus sp. 109]|jgi:hypothetical protein|uniref:hypothetical protein n=1 Tax=Sphingorhabdus sp. 109 TaxID=2653173 RepID=UPI00135674E3|nr:hypothetical protein [Sphingorhabdus sp. 109]
MFRSILVLSFIGSLVACSNGVQNAEKCPLLSAGWSQPKDGVPTFALVNIVAWSDSSITWNGVPVKESQLTGFFAETRNMVPEPLTVYDPVGAPNCDRATELRDIIDKAVDCKRGWMCGLGAEVDWNNATPAKDAL